jgi:cell wall-associated NlpC family hydrolase
LLIFFLRAPRVRRLTASFGLSLTAAGVAIATLATALSTPISALARPSKRHSSSSSSKRVHKAMVRVETARLRSGPGEGHAPAALLDAGRSASIVARKGDWAKLRLATGRTGWVRSDLLSISKKSYQVASSSDSDSSSKKKKRAKKQVQVAQRPVKRVASAKPKHKKPAIVKIASRPATHKAHTPAVAKKPVQFAFSRPLVRSTKMNSSVAAPIVIKTTPVAPESTAAAVVPAFTEAPTETTPIEVTAQAPETTETTAPVSEAVAPVQVALANPEEMAAPVSAPPAKKAGPVVNRSLTRNERIARSALSYRGTPYRMGATGRGAFDCSGFMMYLFDKAGLQLPRTAAEQYRKGTPIPKDQLKAGDLVFFKNTYKHGVSHVGIYIGGGKFCHASSGGHAVRTDNLSKEYYVNHWAGARRPK